MKIRVIDTVKDLSPIFLRKIKRLAGKVAEKETQLKELNIVLVNDHFIRKLNKKYLGKDRSTDVLSFNLGEIGEIYISIDTARRNAKRYNFPAVFEIWRYTLHGILHIAGFEHKDKSHESQMEQEEELYLKLWDNF
ncbi:MAG: rRNA maturation RNase YbeY [Candidatus Hydrothermia bacterium]